MLDVEDAAGADGQLQQYFVRCPATDKFLLLYFILKMKLLPGKAIIFVNDIERCYRVKLFLEQFSIEAWYDVAPSPARARSRGRRA